MKYLVSFAVLLSFCFQGICQSSVADKLKAAVGKFNDDPQMKYGLAGICVLNAKTGEVIFESNGNTALVPASNQKVITAIAAYETLGADYRYKTIIGYTGEKIGRTIKGDLVITGSGDPTLASPRYPGTKEAVVLKSIADALAGAGIDSVTGSIIGTDKGFDLNALPPGWSWGDMGNYYGAGIWGINWNENQYDLIFKTGSKQNDEVKLVGIEPSVRAAPTIINNVTTGKPGTGDASVIYADPFSKTAIIQGELEPNRSAFSVSGSMANADMYALNTIKSYLAENKIAISGPAKTALTQFIANEAKPTGVTEIATIRSPSMDSIMYYFLSKSINLYGEALLRTIGMEKSGEGNSKKGLDWEDAFYKANGFDSEAMHLYDGSGLSVANRITPFAIAKALYFAKGRPWFSGFYEALPLYNGMKLKSGTVGRVKCFSGYYISASGEGYIVSFMVNNYNGSPSALVNKMYAVLNTLK